jgi:hypothetical protein
MGLILRQVFREECRLVWVQAKRLSDLANGQCLLVEKFAVGDWGRGIEVSQVVDVEVAMGL